MKIQEKIAAWLKEYSIKSSTNGFVVGVSGGIDSAAVSTLCAMTGLPVFLLNLPIHQHNDEYERAVAHIEDLKQRFSNVTSYEVDLTIAFESFTRSLTEEMRTNALVMANTRSRLRMTTLYAYAGHHNYLVVGTGNKVEDFGVGFYTKYGDGGVDISPIADLMKSEVYALAAELGVIDSILKSRPTDGLWDDGRTDEDQIGASYDELEWAMTHVAKANFVGTRADLLDNLTARQLEVLAIYNKFHSANKHKMESIPVFKK